MIESWIVAVVFVGSGSISTAHAFYSDGESGSGAR